MTILYIETNFLMSIATGRDPAAMVLLERMPPSLRLMMPSVCYMEALHALKCERKAFKDFTQSLRTRISQSHRDSSSRHADLLCTHLEQAIIEYGNQFNETERRFNDAAILVAAKAKMIEPTLEILRANFDQQIIKNDLKDNLILTCILHHAALYTGESQVLLTGNTRDFGTPEVKAKLRESGVDKLFTGSKTFTEWFGSLPSPENEGGEPTGQPSE